MQKIIVISGPTASGKSGLAVNLAKSLLAQDQQAVIINADSMQVYKEIPIITAQPTATERGGIPHKLYGIIAVSETFSAGKWVRLVIDEIEECFANKQVPILVGGTGLYIRSLMEGMAEIPNIEPEVREKAKHLYEEIGVSGLYEELLKIDSYVEGKIDKDNPKRVMRAWEVMTQTGKSFVQWQESEQKPHFAQELFDCYFLNPPREEVYEKVNERLKQMVGNGILDEVANIYTKMKKKTSFPRRRESPSTLMDGGERDSHLSGNDDREGDITQLPAMKALGIPDIIKYLNDEINLEEAIEQAQKSTRKYVKRQITWFKNQTPEFKEICKADLELIKDKN